MDKHGNIFEADDVPAEDKARLDGYLRAKAEEAEVAFLREQLAARERELAERACPAAHDSEEDSR